MTISLKMKESSFRTAGAALVLAAGLFWGACSSDDGVADNPEEAAEQIDQAFANTEGLTHAAAVAASEAMRKGEYEKAVVSLQTVKASTNITLDQGLAIYSSAVALEAQLISRVEAGDPNAIRAYELLKRMKRD